MLHNVLQTLYNHVFTWTQLQYNLTLTTVQQTQKPFPTSFPYCLSSKNFLCNHFTVILPSKTRYCMRTPCKNSPRTKLPHPQLPTYGCHLPYSSLLEPWPRWLREIGRVNLFPSLEGSKWIPREIEKWQKPYFSQDRWNQGERCQRERTRRYGQNWMKTNSCAYLRMMEL